MSAILKLSPLTRLRLTVDRELRLDPEGLIFNEERYRQYVAMLAETERRRDRIFRSLMIVDALVVWVSLGRHLEIPWFNVELSTVPAVLEILIAYSSLVFFFCSTAFLNWQAYDAIISVMSQRRVETLRVDPDFLSASEVHMEFSQKLFRPKFNIWGSDYFTPQKTFVTTSKIVLSGITIVLIILFFAHYFVIGYALYASAAQRDWTILYGTFWITAGVTNGIAALISLASNFDFSFEIAHPARLPPRAQAKE